MSAAVQRVWASGRVIALAILAAIAVAEFITAYASPLYGVLAHVCILIVLLTLGAASVSPARQAFFLSTAIAPLIRIISLGMPLGTLPQPMWYLLTGVPLFLTAFIVARTLHLSFADLYLRPPPVRHLPLEVGVGLSGVLLGVIEWRILGPQPITSITGHHAIVYLVGVAAILYIFTGFLEELLFRGLIQEIASTLLGRLSGLFFMAALFAALHLGWHSPLDLLFVFGVALYFGTVVRYTHSLLGVTLAHGTINTMLFIILPLAFR
jgi:membrane protease YdiL (CAAX protease family)